VNTATQIVSTWINEDNEWYLLAQSLASHPSVLGETLVDVLRSASPGSPAWETMRELGIDELNDIDWRRVAISVLADRPPD
jgi:hypothetical protein